MERIHHEFLFGNNNYHDGPPSSRTVMGRSPISNHKKMGVVVWTSGHSQPCIVCRCPVIHCQVIATETFEVRFRGNRWSPPNSMATSNSASVATLSIVLCRLQRTQVELRLWCFLGVYERWDTKTTSLSSLAFQCVVRGETHIHEKDYDPSMVIAQQVWTLI